MTVAAEAAGFEQATFAKIVRRVIPLLFICYICAFLDRVNVGFAKLQMAPDLAFSDAVYGFGAGVFFIGYFLFEVPSNLILRKVGARMWIARIMITWSLISAAFSFTHLMHWGPIAPLFGLNDAQFTFYLLRFLLGAAEAGFFPGVILYLTFWFPAARRARMVALFMAAIAVSNLIGSPVSGAIMQFMDGLAGWRGWQWLFFIEALPSLAMGFVILALLPNGPRDAKWLSTAERDMVLARLEADEADKPALGQRHSVLEAFSDYRIWAFCLVYFTNNVCFYAVNFWMPTIIQEFGVPPGDYLRVGLIAIIPWGAMALAQILWASHSDRTGERRWHCASGLLLVATGQLMLALVGESPLAAIAGLTCVTVGIGCFVTVFWTLPTSFLSGAAAAAGIAWINSVGNLGGHFGPDLIGRIRDANGGDATAAFLTLAGAAAIGATVVLLLPNTQPRAPARQG